MFTIRGIAAIAVLFALNMAAFAQDRIDSGQRPPAETPAQAEPVPERCAREHSGFRSLNGVNMFYVEVTSACEKRQRCTISAYVVGSRGSQAGQGTLTLAPGSRGQESKETWSMRTSENGGMANMSWSCEDM